MGEPTESPALLPTAVVPCPPDPQPGRLACLNCRRTVDCPPAELVLLMRTRDWARCCGQVMAYYVPAGKPWEPPPSTPRERTLAGL